MGVGLREQFVRLLLNRSERVGAGDPARRR